MRPINRRELTQTESFMQHVRNGNVKLSYEIDDNPFFFNRPPSGFNTAEKIGHLIKDRNDFLETQGIKETLLKQIKTPYMDDRGAFYNQWGCFKYLPRGMVSNAAGFLQDQLEKIEKSAGGKELLKSLNNSLGEQKKLNIKFSNRSGNQLSPGDEINELVLNPWVGSLWIKNREGKPESFNTSPLIQSQSTLPIYDPDASNVEKEYPRKKQVANIKEGLSPFHVTLAHELTHLNNFFNSKDVYSKTEYEENSDRVGQNIANSPEEHRTVLGAANTSERKYREDFSEPYRYLYQNNKESFREPVSRIRKNVYRPSDISNENFQQVLNNISEKIKSLKTEPIQPRSREESTTHQKSEAQNTKVSILGSLYKQYYPEASDDQLFGYIKADLTAGDEEKWRDFTKRNWKQYSDNKIDKMQNRKSLLSGVDSIIAKQDNFNLELKSALNEKLDEYDRLNKIKDERAMTEAQFKEMLGFGKRMNVDSAQKFPNSYDDARRQVSLLNEMDLGGQKAQLYLQRLKANIGAIMQAETVEKRKREAQDANIWEIMNMRGY